MQHNRHGATFNGRVIEHALPPGNVQNAPPGLPSGPVHFEAPRYGTVEVKEPKSDFELNVGKNYEEKNYLLGRKRRVVNWIPLLLAVFLPWFLFLFVYRSVFSRLHYNKPWISMICVLLAFVICTWVTLKAYRVHNKAGDQHAHHHDKLYASGTVFFWKYHAVAYWIATLTAWLMGDLNFWFFMQPYYDVQHLAAYVNVNPSEHKFPNGEIVPAEGKRYLDAGIVYFKDDVVLDKTKAMSFRNGDLYCVAPLVSKTCTKNCGYDFWAIGLNCCSDSASDFRCGEFSNPQARSGLRLMRDDQRPMFRLAVLAAEGVHKITSPHPLFFYWLQDPKSEIKSYQERGYSMFLTWMFIFFFGNAAAVALSVKTVKAFYADMHFG